MRLAYLRLWCLRVPLKKVTWTVLASIQSTNDSLADIHKMCPLRTELQTERIESPSSGLADFETVATMCLTRPVHPTHNSTDTDNQPLAYQGRCPVTSCHVRAPKHSRRYTGRPARSAREGGSFVGRPGGLIQPSHGFQPAPHPGHRQLRTLPPLQQRFAFA